MEFHANMGKDVLIQANGKVYARHAITTHFVQVGESYIDLVERYVKPVYQPGDILSSSEKVIALCQGRVVTEDQVRPGFWVKLRGIHGTFYRLLGEEVRGLDGFYGEDIPEYKHIGIRVPRNPDMVCNEVYKRTGVVMMIVDANDLDVDLLGKGNQLRDWKQDQLLALIVDNPAGQNRQLTPFILIREIQQT